MVKYRRDPSELFSALADSKRVAILERLAEGEASSTELATPLGLSLPAFAKHLRVLEDAGLIRSRKTGRVRICQIVPEPLQQLDLWLSKRLVAWESNLDRLEAHLKSQRRKA